MTAMPCSLHPARAGLAFLLALAGLATSAAPAVDADQRWDDNARVAVRNIIPPEWRHSVHHHVVDYARLDTDHLVFEMDSVLGPETVHSLALLGIRVHEVATMASVAAQFEKQEADLRVALAGQRGVGSDSVLDLLTRPLETAARLADNLGTNLGNTLEGDYLRPQAGQSLGEAGIDPRILPFKRSVAAQLHLDVYSSNPATQGFLNHLAQLQAAGQLRQVLANIAPPNDGSPLRPRDVQDAQFEALVKNNEPDKLAEMQSRSLRAMGIDIALVHRFVTHEAFTPRHRTYITGYLEQLDGVDNRAEVLASAVGARSEADALAHQAIARLMAAVHGEDTTLKAFTPDSVVPTAVNTAGETVYFIPVDYVAWNLDSATTVQALIDAAGGTAPWMVIAGRFSDRARNALRSQGVPYREGFAH